MQRKQKTERKRHREWERKGLMSSWNESTTHHLIVIFVLFRVSEFNVFLTVSGAIYCKLPVSSWKLQEQRSLPVCVDHQRDVRNIVEYAKIWGKRQSESWQWESQPGSFADKLQLYMTRILKEYSTKTYALNSPVGFKGGCVTKHSKKSCQNIQKNVWNHSCRVNYISCVWVWTFPHKYCTSNYTTFAFLVGLAVYSWYLRVAVAQEVEQVVH